MINFSKEEILHLAAAIIVLTLTFGSAENFLIYLVIVGALVLLHEIVGHKLLSRRYGATTEFRLWIPSFVLDLATSFLGLIFLAPGGTSIFSTKGKKDSLKSPSRKEFGIIALGGPAVNFALGIILLSMSSISPSLMIYSAKVSFFLAAINLVPIGPLDGAKVGSWSWIVWFAAMGLSVAAYFFLR